MPRGSRPGERRGGRQRGTPNKKTLLENAAFLAAAADANHSPLDFMLALMRDPQVPLDLRVDMAAAAAPLVHVRPKASRRPHPMELRTHGLNAAVSSKREKTDTSASRQRSDVSSGAEKGPTLAGVVPEANGSCDSTPLDFLIDVIRDPEAAWRQRIRAARFAARYKHRPPQTSLHLVEDEFGFKIDPLAAKVVHETWSQCGTLLQTFDCDRRPADFKKMEQLLARLREDIESIACPDSYTESHLENDEKRLQELYDRRRTLTKLTPEEDAEEDYLIARVVIYRTTPKHRARCRIAELEERRAVYRTLTAAELSELDDLRARFPTVARDLASVDWTEKFLENLIVPTTMAIENRGQRMPKTDEELKKICLENIRSREQSPDELNKEQSSKLTILEEIALFKIQKAANRPPQKRIYDLEMRRLDQKLTFAEEDELEELRRQYPECVEIIRNLVVRPDKVTMREFLRQRGYDPSIFFDSRRGAVARR